MSTKIVRQSDRSVVWTGGIIRPEQEAAIVRSINEPTHAVCNGSNMDTGKTLQAAEFVIRLGLERVLYIGVKDTFAQWQGRLEAQSDGKIQLLRVDSTAQGKRNYAAMLAGTPGHYFSGSQYITAQDWGRTTVPDEVTGLPATQIDPKHPSGAATFAVDASGEVTATTQIKRSYRMETYKKMAPFEALIFDEIHMVANRKSNGYKTLKSIRADWKVGMSGTWVGNKFENAFAITRWLWGDVIDASSIRWKAEWCKTETPRKAGGQAITDRFGKPLELVTGEKEPGKFVTTLPCYIRLDGEREVPKPEAVYVDLTAQQRADYQALEDDGLVWLQAHPGLEPLITSLPIDKRTRLRTATLGVMSFNPDGSIGFADDCESSTLFALRGIVDRPDWKDHTVGIYCHSKKFVKVTVARMRAAGYNAVEWSGDISSSKRDEIKADFLAGKIQYLVSVIRSFSTGLDGFQAVCNRVIWLSEDDNNVSNEQAIKRYFRSGNDAMLNDFQHVKILARGTVATGLFDSNAIKSRVMAKTLRIAA